MNWMTRSVMGLVCLALVGCAAGTVRLDTERRVAAVDSNQLLAPEVRSAILDGRLLLGMSEGMVAASWGLPRHVDVGIRGGRVRETWEYGARQARGWETMLTFDDGTLTAMERSRTRGGADVLGEFSTLQRDNRPEVNLERVRLVRGLQP
jgi:hypothetical protein